MKICTKMLSFNHNFRFCHFLAGNYICFEGFYCSSFYNDTIEGDMDLVANFYLVDSNCKAFGYNQTEKLGFKCKEFDLIYAKTMEGYQEKSISLCEFESGNFPCFNQ